MSLLAYDPDRLAALKCRLTRAVEELGALRADDPSAADALRAVSTVRAEIEVVWLPLIARIIESEALTRVWWYNVGTDGDLRDAVITTVASANGWSVQRDPLNRSAALTATEARALGTALNDADLFAFVDDRDQVRWLGEQLLAIGRDAALSAAFLATFGAWTTLTYVLASAHARGKRPDIDTAFDGLMSVWATTLPVDVRGAGKSATLAALLPPIDDADPYAQALMVRALQLDALTIATLAHELLTNWLVLKNDPSGRRTLDRHDGSNANAADIVLPLVLAEPAACVWFTQQAARNPAILFETLNDSDVAYQLVLIGTDPRHTTTAAAGSAVLAVLDYFRTDPYSRPGFDTDGHPGEYGPFLGALVAPWLLQFTMSNEEWNAAAGKKAALLRVALDDDAALTQLMGAAERIRAGFNQSLSTHDITAATQVGGLLNLLLQLSVNERVADEVASSDGRFNLMWTVVGVASSFLPGGPLVGIATGFALSAINRQFNEYLGQPDPTGVRRSAERVMDVALTLAGADAVLRLFEQWIADGLIDESHPPPPTVDVRGDVEWCTSAEYFNEFREWRTRLPNALSRQADELFGAFVGSSAAQANCAEIAG